MACAAASCTPARPKLQSGDLLFEAGAGSAMSEAIRSATGSARPSPGRRGPYNPRT